MKNLTSKILNPKSIIRWLTATRRRKILSSILAVLILITGIRFTFYKPKEVKADSLLKFDEGYGTSIKDSSGSASGTVTGATWKTDNLCFSGKCLYFDGNDWISFGDESSYDFASSTDFTIQFWFRHGGTSSSEVILQKYESTGADGGFRIRMESGGDISFGVDDANGGFADDNITSTGAGYDDDQWHYVSAVKDGTTGIYLYIDTLLVASDTSIGSTGNLSNDDNFYIGDSDATDNADEYIGFIDEVKIYTTSARSAAEIKTDFLGSTPDRGSTASFGPDQSHLSNGLVGYWNMDEAFENTCSDSTSDSCDFSGNLNSFNDLTWTNVATASGKFGFATDFNGTTSQAWTDVDGDQVIDVTSADEPVPLNLGGEDKVTVAAWIYVDSAPAINAGIVLQGWGGANNNYLLRLNSSRQALFTVEDVDVATGTTTIPLTTWTHIAGTCDRFTGIAAVYVNGVQDGTSTGICTGIDGTDLQPLFIGSEEGTRYYDGRIDEVRIYNRALSSGEIMGLYEWAPEPVGYWNLNEGSGTTAYDTSGLGNSSDNWVSQPAWTTGKYSGGLLFDGVDDNVEIPDDPDRSTDFGTGDFTMMAWVKTSDTGLKAYFSRYTSNVNFWIGQSSSSTANFWARDSNGVSMDANSSFVINDGQWHHIAGVKQGNSLISVYVDGVLRTSDTSPSFTGNFDTTADYVIGGTKASGSYEIRGSIDDVKLYNYARTPTQIIEDMNAGHPAPGSPVGSALGHWKFEEGYGDTANDSGTGDNDTNLGGSGQTCPAAGTVPCPTWSNSGKFGKALDFGGTDDYASIADSSDLDLASSFSVSLWFNADAMPSASRIRELIAKTGDVDSDVSTDNGNFGISLDNGVGGSGQAVSAGFENSSGTDVTVRYITTPVTGTWYHVAMVFDDTGNSLKLYYNGVAVASTSTTETPNTNNFDVYFGITNSAATFSLEEYYDGKIDEARIYNSALTPDQVKLLYNQSSSAVWGSTATNSSGTATWSSENEYCPPGQGSACTGPAGEWKFDENTGTSAYDTSGNNRTGTLSGGPVWDRGKISSGIKFDGTDDLVTTNTTVNNFITASAGTLEAWAYFTGPAGSCEGNSKSQCPGVIGDQGGYFGITRGIEDGVDRLWFFNVDGTEDFVTGITYTTNTWYHLVWVHSGGNIYAYVNGILKGSAASGDTSDVVTQNLQIGRLDVSYHSGLIDNVRVYNYARTPAQIAWEYNRGAPVAHWKMDECSGDYVNDSAGNSLTGTITPGASGDNTAAGTCSGGTGMWGNGANGKRNASLDFDGTDDIVTIADSPLLTPSDTMTVAVWIKLNQLATTKGEDLMILRKRHSASPFQSYQLYINTTNNTARFEWYNSSGTGYNCNSSIALTTGTWYHLVGVKTSGTMQFYVNGKDVSSSCATPTGTLLDSDDTLRIGASDASSKRVDGQIDEVRIYNYALTQQQVNSTVNEGALRFGPSEGSP